ncbi:MAG: hypothetical protein M0Z87_07980 [Actinomycetota bacterium]|nr:hypothetical protein [Actinomycetota bacterium]
MNERVVNERVVNERVVNERVVNERVVLAPWLTCSDPWATARARGIQSELDGYETIGFAPRRRGYLAKAGDIEMVESGRLSDALDASSALVIPGGTLALDGAPSSPMTALTVAALARGKLVAAAGIGLSSGRGARVVARLLTGMSDLLFVRSEVAARTLVRAGARPPVRVGADPLWLSLAGKLAGFRSTEAIGARSDGTEHLGHVSSWRASDKLLVAGHLADPMLVGPFASAVAQLAKVGLRAMVQTGPGDDRTDSNRSGVLLASAIAERAVGTEVLEGPLTADHALEQSASARLVVAMDWPSVCVAAAIGTPLLAVTDDPEVAALAALLGQTAVTPHAGERAVVRAAATALDGEGPEPGALAGQLRSARGGVGMLRMLLDRGRGREMPPLGSLTLHPEPWAS